MESPCLTFAILVLLSMLVLTEERHAGAQITDEDYWKAVWPNTPIPNPLQDFLKPVSFGAEKYDLPMKLNNTRNPTRFFFNYEIYPGKTMAIKVAGSWSFIVWDQGEVKSIENGDYVGYTREELCEQKGPSIEDKYCAESLRTVMEYVISKLGKDVKPLLSSLENKEEQYRVEGMTNIGQKAVMCHKLNFQKTTFYCHQVHGTTLYSVPLVAGDGTKTQALAVCHFDTSGMNKKRIHQIMKVDPGTKPICHFIGSKEVVWVPNYI